MSGMSTCDVHVHVRDVRDEIFICPHKAIDRFFEGQMNRKKSLILFWADGGGKY